MKKNMKKVIKNDDFYVYKNMKKDENNDDFIKTCFHAVHQ